MRKIKHGKPKSSLKRRSLDLDPLMVLLKPLYHQTSLPNLIYWSHPEISDLPILSYIYIRPFYNSQLQHTSPLYLECPCVQVSIWQTPAHCSTQFNHYLLCESPSQLFYANLWILHLCLRNTICNLYFNSHCNTMRWLFTCQDSSVSEPLLTDLEFPAQAVLHKQGVSDLIVNYWLLNKTVLFYHGILTEGNEIFKE